jgi:hypothetical protein
MSDTPLPPDDGPDPDDELLDYEQLLAEGLDPPDARAILGPHAALTRREVKGPLRDAPTRAGGAGMIVTVAGPRGVGKTPAERIDLLFGKLPKFKPTGKGYVCCCPAHDDSSASLSISVGKGERIVLHCFAGCAPETVMEKMGLCIADLFQPEENGDEHDTIEEAEADADRIAKRLNGSRAGRWDYFTARGELVGRVLRYDLPGGKDGRRDKTFRPLAIQPDGRWAVGAMPAPRPLYRLPHLVAVPAHGVVFVTEGEKAADAVVCIGLNATTFSGGTEGVRQTDYSPLAGRTIVLLPDNDAAGEKCVEKLAGLLKRLDPPATVAVLRLPGLPSKGDAVEFIEARRAAGVPDAAIRGELEALAAKAPTPATVTVTVADPPLPVEPSWPDPPGEEAFYGLAGRIVRTIEPASEASAVALLGQALVAFGNVVGQGPHFVVESDRHRANEFMVLVGRTSKSRKGTSWGRINRLLQDVEAQWAADHVATGLSSGQGLIWHVRDPIMKRERVREKGQVSYVEIEADPGIEDKRLLVVEPEFAACLKLTESRESTLSAVIRNAWDGRDLRILNKNSPTKATGAHISLIGHITAEELRRCLSTTEMANGFANRFLWVCTERSKQLPFGGEVDAGAWGAVRNDLAAALEFARNVGTVSRDEKALELWAEVYGPLSEGRPGLAGALLGRAEAHVMRLALIYALMDCSAVIRAEHLLAALVLWDFCERSVYYLFGDSLGDPFADEVLRFLRGNPSGLTRTDLTHCFGKNQPADRIGRALGLLLQHHLARCERQETGGRPAERWFAARR